MCLTEKHPKSRKLYIVLNYICYISEIFGVSYKTMIELNFFNNVDYLEPRCPKCETKIEYGVTTTFDEKKGAHVCKCGEVLK